MHAGLEGLSVWVVLALCLKMFLLYVQHASCVLCSLWLHVRLTSVVHAG